MKNAKLLAIPYQSADKMKNTQPVLQHVLLRVAIYVIVYKNQLKLVLHCVKQVALVKKDIIGTTMVSVYHQKIVVAKKKDTKLVVHPVLKPAVKNHLYVHNNVLLDVSVAAQIMFGRIIVRAVLAFIAMIAQKNDLTIDYILHLKFTRNKNIYYSNNTTDIRYEHVL